MKTDKDLFGAGIATGLGLNIEELFRMTVEKGASDLHLRVPSPPVFRIDGNLRVQKELPAVTPQFVKEAIEHIASERVRERFYNELELDMAYSIPGLSRFRINAFFQRGTISIAIRQIPIKVPTIDELGLPQVCKTMAMKRGGLVLVTGQTGMGKSTTLAAMIDYINRTAGRNIITIEDPIEYLYHHDKSLIAQRELGDDTKSFSNALRHALREDPDVILVGEMRDLETIATAITAAETGHLVLSTVHTANAPQTIERIIDVFPPHQQDQIRVQLSLVIEGVLSQILVPRASGRGRIAAVEIMMATDAIRNLVREGKTEQIPTYMQTSRQFDMQTMDRALQELVRSGIVSLEEALLRATKPDELKRACV